MQLSLFLIKDLIYMKPRLKARFKKEYMKTILLDLGILDMPNPKVVWQSVKIFDIGQLSSKI